MAQEESFKASLEPTIYFYVNKSTGMVEYVSMYTIFGNTVRPKGEKWTMGSRDDLEKYYSEDYEIWAYESSPDDDETFDGSWDPEDEDAWEVPPVQEWAKGKDISRDEISKYARLVNSGEYITEEEARDIPGE
jgi:hypothetical protein